MSQQNVEAVATVVEATRAGAARGDPGAAWETSCIAADAEFIPAPEIPGAAPSYKGREGFVELFDFWTEDFDRWSIEAERLIDAGDDRVVAVLHQTAVGHGGGVPIENRYGAVYELESGRVVRIVNYLEPDDALRAAGVSE